MRAPSAPGAPDGSVGSELAWSYRPDPDLGAPLAERLARIPREPDPTPHALRAISAVAIRAWLALYHRLSIHGREHLPRDGPFVMVANHQSHLDALALAAAVPIRRVQRTHPAAAADYFFRDPLRAILSTLTINALPFDRGRRSAESLARCRRLLESEDGVLILFPEGTRSRTGRMGRFHTGIGRLVVGTDVPVVPAHLSGADRALPKGACLPRPARLTLRIGPARTYGGWPASRATVRRIAEELRADVVRLGGGAPAIAPARGL